MRGNHTTPATYAIRVQGRLEARWASRFDGCAITPDRDGTTVLSGRMVDQAALHAVLQALRDLGLPLLSLTQVQPDQPATAPTDFQRDVPRTTSAAAGAAASPDPRSRT